MANTLRLLKLPEEVRTEVASGRLSMGHARALLASGAEGRAAEIHLLSDLQASGFTTPAPADGDAPPIIAWSPGTEPPESRAVTAIEVGMRGVTIELANGGSYQGALLIAAAQRGVDVRILTPDGQTDVPLVRWAARAHYGELLAGGVRIWEYRPAMMHAKTFVVDGVWVGIGSMNFDNRSLAVNDESTLLVADTALGAAMERAFLDDLGRATELTRETFPRRGRWERVKERFAVLTSRLL